MMDLKLVLQYQHVPGVAEKNGNIFKYYLNSIKIYESSQVNLNSRPFSQHSHQPINIRISYNVKPKE